MTALDSISQAPDPPIKKTSTTNDPYGIASVEFPCYMAGTWTVKAHFDGNAKDQYSTVSATGNTVWWNGYWVTAERWYITADTRKYPTSFAWAVPQNRDPVFVLLKVENA